ncbi:hypothetical protein V6N12_073898 [Hibiscus sabdariffa]|uniref:DUF7769 domain-containing protein n=1 Tax=Hibiscus sabdariffa TaxID=183260 RepID=A0ABR2AVV8_9ROSI
MMDFEDTNTTMESFLITTSGRQPNKQLSKEQRQALFETLLKQSNNGKLPKGSISQIAAMFLVSTKTVGRLWNQVKRFVEQGIVVDVGSLYNRRTSTKRRILLNMDRILDIPLHRRTNIRSMAKALDMSKSTLHHRIKEGLIKPHTNAIKPYLSDANKRARLQFCLSMLELVARPRFDEFSNCMFSRKIGIFPIVIKEPARRNSKNRQAGTLETKAILYVTKDVTRSCLINKVLPAIRAKWPSSSDKRIFIQQDNAKPHIDIDDEQFLQAASLDGFNFQLFFQPPNSPDLNVLDLGYFRAIQSLQHQESPTTIDELVNGGNNFKLPHIGKQRMERNGELPIQLHCGQAIVQEALL